jgi:hypothetical protein
VIRRSHRDEALTTAGNGEPIFHPTSKKTTATQVGTTKLEIPRNMVLVPEGEFTLGTGTMVVLFVRFFRPFGEAATGPNFSG